MDLITNRPEDKLFPFETDKPVCPCCGAPEMHPKKRLLVCRMFKVYDEGGWWSECLWCSGYYKDDGISTESDRAYRAGEIPERNKKATWFA